MVMTQRSADIPSHYTDPMPEIGRSFASNGYSAGATCQATPAEAELEPVISMAEPT
jgi:hypothetical protein